MIREREGGVQVVLIKREEEEERGVLWKFYRQILIMGYIQSSYK